MRRVFKYTLMIFITSALTFLIFGIITGYRHRKNQEKSIQTLPDVVFQSLDGDSVNLMAYDWIKPLVVVFFNPECEHCQYEALEIAQHAEAFSGSQIVLITDDDSLARIRIFCETYHLWEVDNIEILLDTDKQIKRVFGRMIFPSVYIYNIKRNLRKKFLGEIRAEAIINELAL